MGVLRTVIVTLAVKDVGTCGDVHMSEWDGSATAWIATSWELMRE